MFKVLKCNDLDYNNAYILVRGDIINTAHDNPTPVACKIWAPFTMCVTYCSMRCLRLYAHAQAHTQGSLRMQCIARPESFSKVLSLLFCYQYIFLVRRNFS